MDDAFPPPLCRSLYYRKDGTPIDLMEWERLLQDKRYKIIRQTKLPGSKKWVSTVWLGLDLGICDGDIPLIFETMVFGVCDLTPVALTFHQRARYKQDYAQARWHTEAEAIAGHTAFCRWWRMNRRQRRRTVARRAAQMEGRRLR
jgi:hypothetical protein